MMGLVKWGFWICIALLFVPVKHADENMKSSVLAQEVLQVSLTFFADVSGFCDRNPGACRSGGETMNALMARVKLGAEEVYHYAMWMGNNVHERPQTEMVRSYQPEGRVIEERGFEPRDQIQQRRVTPVQISPSQNTLRPADLQPAWGGSGNRVAFNNQ